MVIADFAVQGTLARDILGNPAEVVTRAGARVPLRCQVDAISFSAHADFPQTSEFLDALRPPHVVLVHGEATEMARLKKALEQHAAALGIPRAVYMPKVTQPGRVAHTARRAARVVGRLAEKRPAEGQPLRGLLVRRGGAAALMHHDDLPRFTTLHPGKVVQRQAVALTRPFQEVRLALELMFEGVQGAGDLAHVESNGLPAGEGLVLRIGDLVTVTYQAGGGASGEGGEAATTGGAAPAPAASPQPPHVMLEWLGGPVADMVADAVVAVALQAAGQPPGLSEVERRRAKLLAAGDAVGAARCELGITAALLGAQFGPAQVDEAQGLVFVDVDGKHVIVDGKNSKVQCADDALRARVEKSLARLRVALSPLDVSGEA